MAAPVDATHSTSDAQATPSFTKPTGLANGDVVFILLYAWGDAMVATTNEPGFPAGFTKLFFQAGGFQFGPSVGGYYKIITNAAGEPATYNFTDPPSGYGTGGPANGGYISRVTGADGTVPVDHSGSVHGTTDPVTTGANITSSQADALLFVWAVNSVTTTPSTPSGMTSIFAGDGGDSCFYSQILTVQTTNATKTSTIGATGNWTIGWVTIKPPAGGVTTDTEFGSRATNPNPFVGPAVLRNRQFSGQHFELPNTNAPLTDTNFEFPQYRNPNVGPTALRVMARQPSLPINIVAPVTDTNPGTGTVAPPNPRVGPPALQRHFVQPVNIVNAPATDTNFEFPSYPPGQRFLPTIFRPYPFLPPAPVAPTGASVSVVPATGQLILTGFAPLLDTGLTPGTGSLALTGFAPVLDTGLTPSTAPLVLTGFAPTVATPVTATPSTGTLILTGFAPTIATPQTFTPTTAALVLTGFAPTITVAPLSTAVSGQFMLLGMG